VWFLLGAFIAKIIRPRSGILSVLLIAFTLSACSNPIAGSQSIIDSNHSPGPNGGPRVAPASGSELVSSSVQLAPTVNNVFVVRGTLASPTDQIKTRTNNGVFVLYSNIQGELISNEQ
jgi:hypothetical protein